LKKGTNVVGFRTQGGNSHHGYLDCFVFSNESFQPQGVLKPNQMAGAATEAAKEGWFAFNAAADIFAADNGFDLRSLNETMAGEDPATRKVMSWSDISGWFCHLRELASRACHEVVSASLVGRSEP
jgi:hypothetical protein